MNLETRSKKKTYTFRNWNRSIARTRIWWLRWTIRKIGSCSTRKARKIEVWYWFDFRLEIVRVECWEGVIEGIVRVVQLEQRVLVFVEEYPYLVVVFDDLL